MAESLVQSLADHFAPEKYHDDYREQVLDLIEKKAAGEEFEIPEVAAEKPKIVDLMAALEASVEAAKSARGRHPAASGRPRRPAPRSRPESARRHRTVVAPSTEVTTEVEGHVLTLSNLAKVLYPSGFTKGQVIDYHVRVASAYVAHLRGRAITFKRFPDGTDRDGFFEKRCPGHRPDWVSVALGPGDRRGGIEYCCIDSLAALVWAGNMAAVEIHAPMALAEDLDRPRAVVFDFDPGPGTSVVECCQVALDLREVLAAVDLEGWCKTSGSKGLQLYVPLNTDGVTPRRRRPVRAGVRSGVGAAAAQAGHHGDGQDGPARADLRGLEPERPPQDHDRAVLAAGPARADRVDAGDLGRSRHVRRERGRRCGSRRPT